MAERKGAPSESNVVSVLINPVTGEPTTLTLILNKTEYISGETMNISGSLKFSSDSVPLSGRTITIEENGSIILTVQTKADGSFSNSHIAPDVITPTSYSYQAKFAGDL